MNKFLLILLAAMALTSCSTEKKPHNLETPFEKSSGIETATYEEGIAWWQSLEQESEFVSVQTTGATDVGLPLHLVVINSDKNFALDKIKESDKLVWLINNGIHPGEPDGIDASMIYAREILSDGFEENYKDVVILIIPFYNVGGALNRNCCSRANQNGPASYGFRGNAKNLDLNRDFVKCDSKNAFSFNALFTNWSPDVYLETHVSNGADYPYTMTFLASQSDKLGPELGDYTREVLSPALYASMKNKNDEMVPYVNVFGTTPDSGYACFYDSPRYSTGYAALHHSIGLLTETHMLKPFKQRVESTLRFLHSLGEELASRSDEIQSIREAAIASTLGTNSFPINWELDSSIVTQLSFSGYEAYFDTSQITALPQLYYDSEKSWDRTIPYYSRMKPTTTIEAPKFYVLPSAWEEARLLLEANQVEMQLIETDTNLELVAYEIEDYQTAKSPYEGHYLHHSTTTQKQYWSTKIKAGTYYLIDPNQNSKRYIIETLEPTGPDSYFNWNFFDEVLQQKEWFSTYVFDTEAEEILKDSTIKKSFDQMKENDPTFSYNAFNQLYFIYRNSPHYERERHMIYPVLRLE
jgi:hypothetical protein